MDLVGLGHNADHKARFFSCGHGSPSPYASQPGARVVRIEPGELPQNFLGTLVSDPRHDHANFDYLAPSRLTPERRRPFSSEPELLPALRPRRDSEHRPSVDCRDFDL